MVEWVRGRGRCQKDALLDTSGRRGHQKWSMWCLRARGLPSLRPATHLPGRSRLLLLSLATASGTVRNLG